MTLLFFFVLYLFFVFEPSHFTLAFNRNRKVSKQSPTPVLEIQGS